MLLIKPLRHFSGFCLLIILAMTGMSSCKSLSNIATADLSRFYNEKSTPSAFRCSVINRNDSISSSVTEFPFSRLSLVKSSKSGSKSRWFRLTYRLYHSIKDAGIADSASYVFLDTTSQQTLLFTHKRDFRASSGSNYILQVDMVDLNTGIDFMLLQYLFKESPVASSWFSFESALHGPLFGNYLSENEKIRFVTSNTSLKTVTVKSFFRNFPAAAPPFVEEVRKPFDYKVDSSFVLSLTNGVSDYFRLPRQGFYFFQPDSGINEGITLYRLYEGYPKVNTPLRMVETLRYITSAQEFKQLVYSSSAKVSVDSFWVAMAGGPDRAVELIRNYYGRVEEANRLFSSFCEGWKTDRGIIYIAFGQPNIVYRSDDQELWIYGEANNYRSMRFNFYKVQNPYTSNDYILQRQPTYKDFWYNSILKWRR